MIGFPLLLIPFAIYNIFVFLMPGVAFSAPLTSVTLMSGVTWSPTFGDALLALGMLLLLLEVIKASRPGGRYLTDHLLSLIVAGAAIAEFVLLPQFGTSTFLLLAVLTVVEFLSGVSLGVRNRRRHAPAAAPVAREPAPVAREPAPVAREPAPAPIAPEPSFDRRLQDHKPQDLTPDDFRPEPSFTSQEIEPPAPKPVPSLGVVRSPENTASAGSRSVADWSVADLVSDAEPKVSPQTPPKT